MQRPVLLVAMILLAAGSLCLGCAYTPWGKRRQQEVNARPIKDMIGDLSDTCSRVASGAGTADLKTVLAFSVDPDGTIPRSGLKTLHSSGSKAEDAAAIQLLERFGDARILAPYSSLSTTTIEFNVEESVTHLAITGIARSAQDANAKAAQLKFIFVIFKATQRDKNPIVTDLLGRFLIGPDGDHVTANLTLSCAVLAEMIQTNAPK